MHIIFKELRLTRISVREKFCNMNICTTEAHCILGRKEGRNK
jgi:hypothetical protein